MPYRLTLTPEDWNTIDFVGHRYAWSVALRRLHSRVTTTCDGQCADGDGDHPHVYLIPEHEAWHLVFAFEQDTEGNHSPFPMLDPRSELHFKLMTFWDSII